MPARDLKKIRFSPAYQQRLNSAWAEFVSFFLFASPYLSVQKLAASPQLAYTWACRFLQKLYETDPVKKLIVARHALLAIEKNLRGLKGKLGESWKFSRAGNWKFRHSYARRFSFLLCWQCPS